MVEHVEHVTLGDEFPGNIPGSLGFQSPDVMNLMNFGWAKLGSDGFADLSASQSRSCYFPSHESENMLHGCSMDRRGRCLAIPQDRSNHFPGAGWAWGHKIQFSRLVGFDTIRMLPWQRHWFSDLKHLVDNMFKLDKLLPPC